MKVSGCGDCPFNHYGGSLNNDEYTCWQDEKHRITDEHETPSWCPLRTASVEVFLSEEEE